MTEIRMKKQTVIDWGLFIYLQIQFDRFRFQVYMHGCVILRPC